MKYIILGAGGLGSVVGGYLAHTGQEVTFIGRQAHMDAIAKNGLEITGPKGDFCIRENLSLATHPDQVEGDFDYLIVCVKSKDMESTLADSQQLVKRVDTVLTLQNGINKEPRLEEWAGPGKVIGASTMEGATLVEPGKCINPFTGPATAYFGELNGEVTPRVEELARAFTAAKMSAKAVDNIKQVTWEKLVQIGMASSWSVANLAGGEYYFIDGITVREGAESYMQICLELLSVYRALGYEPQDFYAPMTQFRDLERGSFEEGVELLLNWGNELKAANMKSRTSMHVDFMRGRKLEVDEIIKPFIDKANELGLKIPTVVAAYRTIKILDHYLQG
ncbi:MAG TPA: ketopantoate reductase family protein [Porticoccaceae bacterium]|nr:ketopantoate reductase family protein [Porticoccaceae bacterium]